MDRTTLESLLDTGRLQVRCGFHWYDVRRNGKTKLWKRSPDRFRIPCKCGFRICFDITDTLHGEELREKPAYRPDLSAKANQTIQRGSHV